MTIRRTLSTACAVTSLAGSVALAQQPNASAAAYGMAGNFTALARGADAAAWNPAGLGIADSPMFSLKLLSINGVSGLGPVSLGDFSRATNAKAPIPASTKSAWLDQIGSGTERGRVDGGVSLVALSVGRIGFQFGVAGTGVVDLNKDAAEALLFGNAGRTGSPKDLRFAGSNARGSMFTTGAVSLALPLSWKPLGGADEQFAFGLTGKYVVGTGVLRAQDNGSVVTSNNIVVSFPMIYSSQVGNNGSGMGVDIGGMWSGGGTVVSLAARNVVNTFAWSTTGLSSRAGTVTFDGNTSKTNFDSAAYSAAPASMRAALEGEKFTPEIAAGLARRVGPALTVTVDGSQRIGDGIDIGPRMHAGVGAQYTGLGFLPLRAGVAAITGGVQLAGGVGLRLGPYELGAAVTSRTRDSGSESGVMLSLISIR